MQEGLHFLSEIRWWTCSPYNDVILPCIEVKNGGVYLQKAGNLLKEVNTLPEQCIQMHVPLLTTIRVVMVYNGVFADWLLNDDFYQQLKQDLIESLLIHSRVEGYFYKGELFFF